MKRDERPAPLEAFEPDSRKPFRKPRIVEWGTIVELTSGAGQGTEDAPYSGGTGTGFGPIRPPL